MPKFKHINEDDELDCMPNVLKVIEALDRQDYKTAFVHNKYGKTYPTETKYFEDYKISSNDKQLNSD